MVQRDANKAGKQAAMAKVIRTLAKKAAQKPSYGDRQATATGGFVSDDAGAEPENLEKNMRMKGIMIVGALTLLSPSPAKTAEDLSGFGIPVDGPRAQATTRGGWTADVCAEIQRVETLVSEDARPVDRGMLRYGLLHLEMKHCGIDISKKLAADQAALEEIRRQSGREFDENMAAARREASRLPQPIIVQVPQGSSGQSSLPDPSPPVSCVTTRLGGGISTTSCR